MTEIGVTTFILIIANIFCSVHGLYHRLSFERNNFQTDKIILGGDYKRLLTPGFFHVSHLHLILNIVTICFFSGGIEMQLGPAKYLLIYFAGLIGGNLVALFIHRNHVDYSSVGATGAITGIIFATILLFPAFEIGFLGIHFPIPGWFYGALYVIFSIYGIKSKRDNIGHETNLAGGLVGLITAILLEPVSILHNYLLTLVMVIPSLFFIYIIINKPTILWIDNLFFNQYKKTYKPVQIYVTAAADHQSEIDLILEKIHQNGIASLSKTEKEKLDYYSKTIQ